MFRSVRSFCHMLSLPQDKCEIYCREKRLARHQLYGGRVRHLHLHSLAHRILIPLLRLDLFLAGNRIHILSDERKKTKQPVIYCPTHIGGVDIEMSFLAVHSPCWIALGNPREVYKSLDGMLMQMNGWIPLDVHEKPDRTAAKAQMKALLDKGGNLLIFPEGTQNIYPNVLVGHLYAGAVDLAIQTGAEIVPIAIGRDEKHYYFAIGQNIGYDNCHYEDRFELTKELRDRMATLKWEVIEQLPTIKRAEVSNTAYDEFVQRAITMNTEYTLTAEDVYSEQFHPKGITDASEAFEHLRKIEPSFENAFLLNKHI